MYYYCVQKIETLLFVFYLQGKMIESVDNFSDFSTKCGLFAVVSKERTFNLSVVQDGLTGLQHRGQESAGITYVDLQSGGLKTFKGFGFVDEVFGDTANEIENGVRRILNTSGVSTYAALGHVRYSTSGVKERNVNFVQPMESSDSTFVIAHNGNIPLTISNKDYTTDTQYLLNRIQDIKLPMVHRLYSIVNKVPGAFCMIVMTNESLWVVRDRYGFRPLCLGTDVMGSWYISSEDSAFSSDIARVRDVNPGEIVEIQIRTARLRTHNNVSKQKLRSHCLFEFIYFMRPDTIADTVVVEDFRKRCGKQLANSETKVFDPNDDTVVVGAPFTGIPVAREYAQTLGLKYDQNVLQKERKRRTFILPKDRDHACETIYKYSPALTKGKTIIVIDDSIVRGTTLKNIIAKLFEFEAKAVHIRIASPPVKSECYFGIDIPTKEELVGHSNTTIDNIRKHIGATSLRYLTIDEMVHKCLPGLTKNQVCHGCFSGEYPNKSLEW